MDSKKIIQSYVWHKDKCFLVSTIERDSSAMIQPPPRYNETIVCNYDHDKKIIGEMITIKEDNKGSINVHNEICESLRILGFINLDDE